MMIAGSAGMAPATMMLYLKMSCEAPFSGLARVQSRDVTQPVDAGGSKGDAVGPAGSSLSFNSVQTIWN